MDKAVDEAAVEVTDQETATERARARARMLCSNASSVQFTCACVFLVIIIARLLKQSNDR